jgi:lysophospholipase L1-like esterase
MGVGSSNPENSFAGVLAQKFSDKSIENNAEIGETTKSLQNTLDKKLDGNYETIYIIIGGNDIMRMHINLFTSKKSLNSVVKKTSKHANKIVLVTTGNFKYVSLAPAALRGVFDMRAKMLRDSALALEAESDEVDYIDFYSVPLKESEYKQLEAADGYHLNDDGIQRLIAAIP